MSQQPPMQQPPMQQPPPFQPPPYQAPGKPKKPWYKRWWAIVIFVLIGLGILGNLIGDNDDDTATPTATTPAATQPAQTTPADDPTTEAPAPTTEAAAPMTTEAVEPEPTPEPEPTTPEPEPTTVAPEPEPTEAGKTDDERLEDVKAALGMGQNWEPEWVTPITNMELQGDTLFVNYQESLFDEEKVKLGQGLHNFLRDVPGLEIDTFVITDTSGIDFNVWCGKTICADSIWHID